MGRQSRGTPPSVGTSVYSNQHCDSGTAATTTIARELGQELQEQHVGVLRDSLRRWIQLHAVLARRPFLSKRSGLMLSPERQRLQTTFSNEAPPNRRDVRLTITKRSRRRVDRVVTEDEIVLVRSGRAENKFRITQRFEFDRLA